MTPTLTSFPPIARADARILILGSMPGQASLQAGEYYAHPRNGFWPILGELLGFDPALPYASRVEALQSGHVAVWDVLRACRRQGSADAKILRASEQANDLAGFLSRHRQVRGIFFNGQTAAQAYRRHRQGPSFEYQVLPSTSPANARLSLAQKCAAWRVILAYLS